MFKFLWQIFGSCTKMEENIQGSLEEMFSIFQICHNKMMFLWESPCLQGNLLREFSLIVAAQAIFALKFCWRCSMLCPRTQWGHMDVDWQAFRGKVQRCDPFSRRMLFVPSRPPCCVNVSDWSGSDNRGFPFSPVGAAGMSEGCYWGLGGIFLLEEYSRWEGDEFHYWWVLRSEQHVYVCLCVCVCVCIVCVHNS